MTELEILQQILEVLDRVALLLAILLVVSGMITGLLLRRQ